jgi:pilus assembly protein FimV
MQKKRPSSSFLIGLVLLSAAHGASAIGWTRAQQTAVLGQPLDFNAALRLDPGDRVPPECVAAEVTVGEQRLPPPGLRLQVDSSNPAVLAMRVLTLFAIDEPVVTVALAIGCPAHMSRRFVLLVDPPLLSADTLPVAVPVTPPMAAPAEPPASAVAAPAATSVAGATAPQPEGSAIKVPAPPHRRAAKKPPPSPRPAAPSGPEPVARLKLEPVDPPAAPPPAARAVDEAIEAVAWAASAARAAASAASAAEERAAALERDVERLRQQAQASRDLAAELRTRAPSASAPGAGWIALLAALAVLAGLTAWLGWRLRVVQRDRQAAWRRAAAADASIERAPPPPSQVPLVTSEILPMAPEPEPFHETVPPITPPPPMARDQWLRAAAESAAERTEVLSPPARADAGAPRDVSIEELLDLEQQAEFFIVLGQEDAAVDLLVGHLRETGGGSPLPYLKLLEICRRRGERDAYERTRARFNQRFNAYAPDWDADLQQGRSLDDYPGVLPRLQQVWPRPLDAMAELEVLLFRKSRGELFDLPAYREVLLLYSLARDLLDREGADAGAVDLLLPLADGGEFSATAPHPYFGLERDSVFDTAGADRSTVPVDLDLSQPDPATIVKPLSPQR